MNHEAIMKKTPNSVSMNDSALSCILDIIYNHH